MSTTHAPAPDSATACTCGRTFASHMGRRNHLTAAAKRAANEAATAARMAQVKADAHPLTTAASRRDGDTIPARVAAAILANPAVTDARVREAATAAVPAPGTRMVTPPADARPGDYVALVDVDTYAGRYELADVTTPRAHDYAADEPIGRVDRVIIALDGSTVLELDWLRHEAAGRTGRTSRALTVAEPDTCEHGIPMDAPCGPCAVAGHEPVDVEPETADALVDRIVATHPEVARRVARAEERARHEEAATRRAVAAERTDDARHLADCRGCALHEPDGHAYVSIINVPATPPELAAFLARTDLTARERASAALALVEECADELARINDPGCADYVVCVPACGNDVNNGAGFWPAGPTALASPEVGSGWDGTTIACLECGRLIDTAADKATPAPGDTWTPWRSPVVGCIVLPDLSTEPRPGE